MVYNRARVFSVLVAYPYPKIYSVPPPPGKLLVFHLSMLIKGLVTGASLSLQHWREARFSQTTINLSSSIYVLLLFFISSRCSDGFDRHRSEWLTAGCNSSGVFQVRFQCMIQTYLANK